MVKIVGKVEYIKLSLSRNSRETKLFELSNFILMVIISTGFQYFVIIKKIEISTFFDNKLP